MRFLIKKKYIHFFTVIYALIVAVFSAIPVSNSTMSKLFSFDKILHSVAYTVLTILTCICFAKRKHYLKLALIYCFLYGIILELFQNFIPYRVFEYQDIFFNFSGCLLGIVIFKYILIKQS